MFGRWFGGKHSPALHPWLEDVARLIEGFGRHPTRVEGALRLESGPAVTTIRFRPVSHQSTDGVRSSGVFEVHTEMGPDFPDSIGKPEALAAFNANAALGAALPAVGGTPFHVRSRVTAYEGDEPAHRIYCSLLAASALTNASVLTRSIADAMGFGFLPPEPTRQSGPSKWVENDFSRTEQILARIGLVANASPTGLVTEFPWDEGSRTALLDAGRTALLELETRVEHPALGAGLFTKLALPMNINEAAAVRLATELNRSEAKAIDAPPFFGAWCVRDADVYFVSFFPNYLRHPQLPATIASWMGMRVKMAKHIAEGSP